MSKAIWIAILLGTILLGLTGALIFRPQSLSSQPQKYTLIIKAYEGGTTDPEPNTYTYEQGVNVTIRGIPNSNYRFGHWALDGTDLADQNETITVTMNRNHTVEVFFRPLEPEPEGTYTLTIGVSPSGGGWVMIETPLGIGNIPEGEYNFTEGMTITLDEVPNLGYQFVNWLIIELDSGNGYSLETDSIDVEMTQNIDVTAFFELIPTPPPKTHVVVIATTKGGTTNPAPNTYFCIDGDSLTVTAIPEPDYIFDGWEVNLVLTNYTSPMTLTITEDTLIVAYFTMKHTYTPLSVEAKMKIETEMLMLELRGYDFEVESFFDVFVEISANYGKSAMGHVETQTLKLAPVETGYSYNETLFTNANEISSMSFKVYSFDGNLLGGLDISDVDFVKYLSDEYFKLM